MDFRISVMFLYFWMIVMNSQCDAYEDNRDFLSAEQFMQEMNLHPQGHAIAAAVRLAQTRWHEFSDAFSRKIPYEDHFFVAVVVQVDSMMVPMGVQVQRIEGNQISGELVLDNRRHFEPIAHLKDVQIDASFVIDWMYASLFEMQGGFLYNEILSRLNARSRWDLTGRIPYMLSEEKSSNIDDWVRSERKGVYRPHVVDALKALWRGDYETLEKIEHIEPGLWEIQYILPVRLGWRCSGGRKYFWRLRVVEFAAMYCPPQAFQLALQKSGFDIEEQGLDFLKKAGMSGNAELFDFLWKRLRAEMSADDIRKCLIAAMNNGFDEIVITILKTDAEIIMNDERTIARCRSFSLPSLSAILDKFGIPPIANPIERKSPHLVDESKPWLVNYIYVDDLVMSYRNGDLSLQDLVVQWQDRVDGSIRFEALIGLEIPSLQSSLLVSSRIHSELPLPMNRFEIGEGEKGFDVYVK